MKWRKWLRIIHRDMGYILVGLTVIYSISGIAVNHMEDWNPNYIIEKKTVFLSLDDNVKNSTNLLVDAILKESGVNEPAKKSFRPDSSIIKVFTENSKLQYDLQSEALTLESVKSRTGIRETNFLHLNGPKKVWTYVADTFAVCLIFLAISGLFMIKGKKGFKWRGALFLVAGIVIPVIFLIIYFY